MWVSWKRQQTGEWPPRHAWRATVGETKRVAGKPRVTILGDLASVAEGKEEQPANRFAFWTRVERRFGELGVADADRDRFRVKLAERVAPFDDSGAFADPAEWLALHDLSAPLAMKVLRGLAPTLAPDDLADRTTVIALGKARRALRAAEAEALHARRRIADRSAAAAPGTPPA